MAYVIDKRIKRVAESKEAEVSRIHRRWTEAGVSACRCCGAPIIIHSESECRATRVQIEEEENRANHYD